MKSNYARIQNFGSNSGTRCEGDNTPLTYCLAQTTDKNFQNSPYGIFQGPVSRSCQLYMGNRCAKQWDGFCEYNYQTYRNPGTYPNNRVRPNMFTANPLFSQVSTQTLGDAFLDNVLKERFCEFPNCIKKCEKFDPLVPQSPNISYWVGQNNTKCVPVCNKIDPKTIDEDPVMNHALENPGACMETLINICNTSTNLGIDLSGTKLGNFCSNLQQNVSRAMNRRII